VFARSCRIERDKEPTDRQKIVGLFATRLLTQHRRLACMYSTVRSYLKSIDFANPMSLRKVRSNTRSTLFEDMWSAITSQAKVNNGYQVHYSLHIAHHLGIGRFLHTCFCICIRSHGSGQSPLTVQSLILSLPVAFLDSLCLQGLADGHSPD
jgi:hypothetical protein